MRVRIEFKLCLLLSLLASVNCASALSDDRAAELPKALVNVPPMVKEESLSTYVQSEAAPGEGLAVNLVYSAKPRYKDGAPVVVVVPGGNGPQGLDFDMHAAQQGFIEIRFAFQGGGKPGFSSSGIYDNRGIHSQEALRDVLRFAAGEIADYQGRKISQLLPCSVSNKTIGAVGWSNGGNTLLVTLGRFAEQLPFVSWVGFYESPVGAMFYPPSLGGAQDMQINKHYRQGTGATGQVMVDYRKLRYQRYASKAPGLHKKLDEPELAGLAYFDENDNNVWDETSEFAIPYSTDIGIDKQIYPPQVTRALLNLSQFKQQYSTDPKRLKSDVMLEEANAKKVVYPFAKYDESLAYFRERDGSLYIKQIVEQHPDMAFTIFGSHLDHLQRQPDHPHIALLYNSLLAAKPKFVRLNPSSVYVEAASFMKQATFVENRPNSSIESDTIGQYLEPEGLLPVYVYMDALCAELSDRVRTNKWMKTIELPLINFSNGAKPPEAPNAKGKKPTPPPAPSSEEPTDGDKAVSKPSKAGTKTSAKKSSPPQQAPAGSPEASSPKDWPFKK